MGNYDIWTRLIFDHESVLQLLRVLFSLITGLFEIFKFKFSRTAESALFKNLLLIVEIASEELKKIKKPSSISLKISCFPSKSTSHFFNKYT